MVELASRPVRHRQRAIMEAIREVVGKYAREVLFDMVEEAPEIGERRRSA